MNESGIEIKGLDRIIAKLDKVKNAQVLNKAVTESCQLIEAQAKRNVVNGENVTEWKEDNKAEVAMVKAMITHSVRSSPSGCTGKVGINSLFAIWMHQGTGLEAINGDGRKEVPWFWRDKRTRRIKSSSGKKPTQFLLNALDDKRESVKKIFKRVYKEAVK